MWCYIRILLEVQGKKKKLTNFATVKIGASCKSNLVVDPFQISLDEGVISNCPEILLQFTLYLK